MTVDMGNGYQAIYGQLKDVPFQAEEYVSAGAVLGYVNEPTKYYTKEGANLYFALQKDGTPLDPLQYLPVKRFTISGCKSIIKYAEKNPQPIILLQSFLTDPAFWQMVL